MKRQSKVKHQGPSVEDEGETSGLSGDTAETEKVQVGKGDGSDYGKSLNPDPVQTDHILERGSLIKRLKSIRYYLMDEVHNLASSFPQQQTDHSKRHRSELFHTEEAENRKFKRLRLISCRRQKRKSPVALPKCRSKEMDSSRMKQSSVIKEKEGRVSWEMSGHRQEEELVKDRKTEPDQQTKHLDQSVFGSAETQKVQDVSYLTPALPFQVCSSDDDKRHTSQIWPTDISHITDISGRHIGSSSCLIQATDDESPDSHPDSSTFPKLEMSSTRLPTELYHDYLPSEIPDYTSSEGPVFLPERESQVYHHLSPLFMPPDSQPKKESTIPPPVPYPSGSTSSTSTFPINSHVFLHERKPQVEHRHFSHSMPSYSYPHSKKKSTIFSAAAHQPGLYYLPSEISDSASSQDLNFLPGESQVNHHLPPIFMSSNSQPKKESTIPPPVPYAPWGSASSTSISPMNSHVFLPEKKPQVEHRHFSHSMPSYSYPHSKKKSTIFSAAAHQPGLYYLPSEISDSASSQDLNFLPGESTVNHHLPPIFMSSNSQPKKESTISPPVPYAPWGSPFSTSTFPVNSHVFLPEKKPQVEHRHFSHSMPSYSYPHSKKKSTIFSAAAHQPGLYYLPSEISDSASSQDLNFLPGESQVNHHLPPIFMSSNSQPKKESTIPPPVPYAPWGSASSTSISPMNSHVFLPEKKPQVEHRHFSHSMPSYSYPHSKKKSTIFSAAAHQPGLYHLPSEISDSASSQDLISLPEGHRSQVYHQHLPSPMPLKTCHSAASHPSLSISARILDILHKKKPQVDHHNFSLVASHPHPKPGDSGYSENKTSRVQSPFPNRPKVTIEPHKATNVLSTRSHHVQPLYSRRSSRCLSRSHSDPSLSKVTSAETETLKRSKSLPDMKLNSSFEEFTPDISVGEDDETYSFRFFRSGLYQCSVTGLLFHMEGEGDVVYRTVPWNRRLLAQHHKKPAGPLFDIKCEQQSVCQLHLPHCEILSTGRRHFLSVAHVNDGVMEFISPHKITETHVVVNVHGFSEFGNVMDEGAPPDPVRALVLLFYKPPTKTDPESMINVLMLPKNISLPDVLRFWKKLGGDERYIKTSPHCKLHPDQDYTLSTCPEDDSVLVQPTEAEFDCSNYDNYFPSFQVELERIMKHIKLLLRDKHSSNTVWERRVCLSYAGVKRSCEPSPLDLPSDQRLLDVRSSFIESVSDPVLKTLLDRLFDKKVINDSERESADEIKNNRDKARCVIDTVRRKGEAASSEMIEFLCELDPFLCEHLGLM